MILSVLLSATFTFTATATGVEKGTVIEFLLAGQNTDRSYESMFILDEPVDALCLKIESAVPRGAPVSASACRLWPTGCRVRFEPPLDQFVRTELGEGERVPLPVYTGGTRLADGKPEAVDIMPAAFFATYSLPQSPLVYAEPVDQGSAYGRFTAAVKLEKGTKIAFKMVVDEHSIPKKLDLMAEKGSLQQIIRLLQTASVSNELDVTMSFSESLSVDESIAVARALSVIDSSRVKINGAKGLFYRAFLPLEKWRDRQERLHQPFELTLREDGSDELLFIDEDWTVEGNDPKLTPRRISYQEALNHPDTDTCFFYVSPTQSLSRISQAMKRLEKSHVVNWYVFSDRIFL